MWIKFSLLICYKLTGNDAINLIIDKETAITGDAWSVRKTNCYITYIYMFQTISGLVKHNSFPTRHEVMAQSVLLLLPQQSVKPHTSPQSVLFRSLQTILMVINGHFIKFISCSINKMCEPKFTRSVGFELVRS